MERPKEQLQSGYSIKSGIYDKISNDKEKNLRGNRNASVSSKPFLFSDIRSIFKPDFSKEKTFSVYEQRIEEQVQNYVNREVNCFRRRWKEECFSFNNAQSSIAAKPYNASLLSVHYKRDYPSKIESTICNSVPVKVLVGIPVSPVQFVERRAIRKTWCSQASVKDPRVRCIFFCGISEENGQIDQFVKEESQKYNDIVQFGFQNSYLNLTLLQLYSYNWALQNCSTISYFIRADSDMFMNLRFALRNVIPIPKERFAYGAGFSFAPPIRNPLSKWYMPEFIFPGNVYPDYLSGCVYIWSKDILQFILEGTNVVRPLHYLDDVYYGQVFHHYNIPIVSDYKRVITHQIPLSRKLWKKTVAVHRYSPIDLLTIWTLFGYTCLLQTIKKDFH